MLGVERMSDELLLPAFVPAYYLVAMLDSFKRSRWLYALKVALRRLEKHGGMAHACGFAAQSFQFFLFAQKRLISIFRGEMP